MHEDFETVLNECVEKSGRSSRWIAHHSGIDKDTINRWRNGKVRKPRFGNQVVTVARVLGLADEADANRLLKSAGRPTIMALKMDAAARDDEEEIRLLGFWKGPFMAPARREGFIGRKEHIEKITQHLQTTQHSICTIFGPSGSGKTATAIEIAHQLSTHFTSGVIWANILDGTNVTLLEILKTIARIYGRPDLYGAKSTIYTLAPSIRNLLADKAVLVVLENVQDIEHVHLLRPPTTGALLITTENPNLKAGGVVIDIQSSEKAMQATIAKFTNQLGHEWVKRDKPILEEIGNLLGHTELALEIMSRLLLAQRSINAQYLLDKYVRLEYEQLEDEANTDDRGVRIAFNVAYHRYLLSTQRAFYNQLTVFSDDFDKQAAARVTHTNNGVAQRYLNHLLAVGLLERSRTTHYRLPPLLRTYAYEYFVGIPSYQRFVQHYIDYAAANRYQHTQFRRELNNILQALHIAHEQGLYHELVAGIIASLNYFLNNGLWDRLDKHLQQALQLAQNHEDDHTLAQLYTCLGLAAAWKHDYVKARPALRKARKLEQTHPHLETQLLVMKGFAELEVSRNRHNDANPYWQAVRQIANEVGNVYEASMATFHLAQVEQIQGNVAEARRLIQQGLNLVEQIPNERVRIAFRSLEGTIALDLGEYREARQKLKKALQLARSYDYPQRIAALLMRLGYLARLEGKYEDARDYLEEGLERAKVLNDKHRLALYHCNLGEVLGAMEQYETALDHLQRGLRIARDNDQLPPQGTLHIDIGVLHWQRERDFEEAERYLLDGLRIAQTADVPKQVMLAQLELAEIYVEIGRNHEAKTLFSDVLTFATSKGLNVYRGLALYGLGRVAEAQNNQDEAHSYATESLSIFKRSTHYRAREIKKWVRTIKP